MTKIELKEPVLKHPNNNINNYYFVSPLFVQEPIRIRFTEDNIQANNPPHKKSPLGNYLYILYRLQGGYKAQVHKHYVDVHSGK